MDENKIRLLSGMPLIFSEKEIKQKTLREIAQNGVKRYYDYCFPFILSLEYLEIDNKDLSIFDLFWVSKEKINDEYLLETLVNGLAYFFNTENIKLNTGELSIVIDDDLIINRDNFESLAEIFRLITVMEKLKPEKKKYSNLIKNERVSSYLKAREKYKKKNNSDNNILESFYDVINYLVHCQEVISYNDVLDLTMYQAINTFNTLNRKEKFNINLNSYYAGAKVSKEDLEHWFSKNET